MGLVSTLSTPHCNKYSMSSGRVLPVTAIMGFRNPISERIFLAASGPCISVITESSRMQSKGSLLLRMASKAVTPSSASTIVQLNSLPPVKIGERFHRLRLERKGREERKYTSRLQHAPGHLPVHLRVIHNQQMQYCLIVLR